MNPQTDAARAGIAGFLDALDPRVDTILTLQRADKPIPLKASHLRLVLAALDEQPDQRPVMHAVSGLCTWKTCGHAERAEIYRMIGTCANCHGGPYLMLFTVGHERHALNCPACGTQNLRATRLATADEIGTTATGNDESEL